uniref:Uncharacterized protein n=1 Tax=Tanacetum cinerariifolium TaxID=118510 RepID=A0A6L2NBS8_TANCI|nr:hypothetical protein [Tanacetum cinerariifolium]
MDTTIKQQVEMDEALVPHAQRLRIERSNFRLLSDIKSKESTLKLVYDVLCLCPFFKAFLVTSNVPEIYMQEFWATATVHHHAIRFKMDNKKHIVNLESFRDMLHICPRVHGAAPPKPKASVWKIRSSFDTTITPPTTTAGPRLTTSEKGKQIAKASKAKSLSALSEVAMTEAQQLKLVTKRSLQQTHISQASGSGADEGTGDDDEGKDGDGDEEDDGYDGKEGDGDDDDEDDDGEEGDDDEADQEVEKDDEQDDEEEGGDDEQESNKEEFIHPSLSTHTKEERRDEESFDPILKTLEDFDDEGNGEGNLSLNVGRKEGHVKEEEEDELYRDQSLSVSSQFVTSMLNPTLDVGMESIFKTTSQKDVQTPTSVAPLPMTAPTMTPSTIATITTTSQAPILPTTAPSSLIQDLPNFGSLFGFDNRLRTLEANFSKFRKTNQFARASDRLRDEAQKENDEFLKTIDENIQKIIKEQVKEQVKTSYAVAADLFEMELKKILIEKIKGNKDDAMVILIRMKNPPLDQTRGQRDAEKERSLSQQVLQRRQLPGALAGLHKGLDLDRRRQESLLLQRSQCRPPFRWKSPHIPSLKQVLKINQLYNPEWFSQQQKPPTPDRDWNKTFSATHGSIQPWISELAKQSDSRSSFNELMDAPLDFSNFLINRLNVNPEGQQYPYNLLKPLPLIPNNRGRRVISFEHFINNDLEYLRGGASSRKYTTSVIKTKAADYGHIKWIKDLVPKTMWIEEPIGYDKHALWGRRIIAVTELKIVEWHNYKHLDWITVRRDDDKLYKFKEGDFKRLRIQDIEDMLLLLVQGKLTNLTVEERFAFNVSFRMFTRSIVIQRRVKDLQLGSKATRRSST